MKHNGNSIQIITGAFILLCWSVSGYAAGRTTWDQWLDNAYQLTWHDQQDIENWIRDNEKTAFDKKLITFANEWEQRFYENQDTGEFGPFPDMAYRHLAIAQLLLYLRSYEPYHLEKALAIVEQERYKSKLELPVQAFWYYYIRAHQDVEKGDSGEFIKDIFHIWLDVIVKMESDQYALDPASPIVTLPGFYQSMPSLYTNLANLILRRAIIQRRMSKLDSLGIIVWNLSQRMSAQGYGKWVEQVAKRIYGPESDNFRLTYTVLFMEAEKFRLTVEDLIDSAKDKDSIEKNIISAFKYYEFLYALAKTNHGKATATTKHLNLTSFILSRLYEKDPRQSVLASIPMLKWKDGRAWHESNTVVNRGIALFGSLAETEVYKEGWQKNGFINRKTYVAAMNDLWRAIMYLCIDTGIYYKQFVDPKQAGSLKQNMPLLEKALTRYLTFFEKYAAKGYLDIVPDNAFFGATEASERLSEMQFLTGSWENKEGILNYDLSHARRLQAAELFPFDAENFYLLANQLDRLGRPEAYKKSVLLLANHVKHSTVIADSVIENDPLMGKNLLALQKVIPEIILRAPNNIVLRGGLDSIPQAVSERADLIAKEFKSAARQYKHKIDAASLKKISDFAKRMREAAASKSCTKKEIIQLLKTLHPIVGLSKEASNLQILKKRARGENEVIDDLFSNNFKQACLELKQIEEEAAMLIEMPVMKQMRETMVLDVDHPLHTLLRRFYYEHTGENLNYSRLLKGKQPIEPISLYLKYSPTIKRLTREQMKKNKTF